MLLFITPNPCIERTLEIDDFVTGAQFRVDHARVRADMGGKGVNAARVAARLGAETLCSGWVGRDQKAWFERKMTAENRRADWVEVEADTRFSFNVIGARNGARAPTEIVEAGAPVSLEDGTRLLQKVDELAPRAILAAIGGSYPPAQEGHQSAFDAHGTLLLRTLQKHDVKVLYDGKGRAFEMALRAGRFDGGRPPWAIKPNLEEASALLHRPIAGEAAERRAIAEFLKWGVEVVLLSCGARGLWLGTAHRVTFLTAPSIEAVSAVGSGDALVGAFLARYFQTPQTSEAERLLDAARWGVAAGAANASQKWSAHCTREEIEALLPQVELQRQIFALAPKN